MAPLITIAQFRPRKADYRHNISMIGGVLRQATALDHPADVVVFPETATSGYFLEGGVRDVAVTGGQLFADLSAEHEAGGGPPVDVVVGFYEEYHRRYHNSAMYATLGGEHAGVRHIHRKVFLPTYGVFDESRFVQPGRGVRAFDTRFGRAAMVICEDAWHSLAPTLGALGGADSIYIPSASPARGVVPATMVGGDPNEPTVPSSIERWERLARTIAGEHGTYVVLAQLVGFEGGKGFPGVSVVAGPRGELLARGPLFQEALVPAECHPAEVTRARADMPLLSDLREAWPHLLDSVDADEIDFPADYDPASAAGAKGGTDRATFQVLPPRPTSEPLAIDPELTARWLSAFIHEEVVTRRGFARSVVGLSGGVDSSLTAFLGVAALGRENIIGVRMPYVTSSPESLEHAALVAERLGIELLTVDITAAVDGFAGALDAPPDPTRLGNVMARTRMITLFDLSAARGALPLGTGNKTERLLGYFTWHADDSPPVNPLGDLFKTQVWALARHVGVPEEIVDKPATADLIEGQTDEGDLGISYDRADRILHALLEGYSVAELAGDRFSADDVEAVNRRLASTHWKRRLPTVAMVSQTAIGEYYLRPVDY